MPVPIVYVTALMMVVSLFPLPETYRSLLNVMVFGTFSWGAYRNFEPLGPMTLLAIVYTVFAIVFNPISPVALSDMAMNVAAIAGAVLLLATAKRIAR